LQQNGYHTAAIGKWHLGMNWPGANKTKDNVNPPIGAAASDGPTTRGFDYFCGYTHSGNIGMIVEQDKVSVQLETTEVQPYLAQKAIEFINQRAKSSDPFFLYLPICTPHLPIVPADEFLGKSGAKEYGDWLYQGDWVVGQVLESLDRNQLADNTLVIVTSDNGAAKRIYSPLRNCKTSIYEGGHRVPFYARWPGKIKAHTVCNETICLTDLLATFAEILNVKLPPNAAEDSFSILPVLHGESKTPIREATVHQSHAGDLAIRKGPWKLIFLKNGEQELYNLKDDLSEVKNLAEQLPDVVDELAKLMRNYMENGRSTPGDAQKNDVVIKLAKTANKNKP
ncbi:MAG: sulfatase-like hydrolase/transferase, partial [Pirellula sp.]